MSVDNAAETVTLWIDEVEAAILTNAPCAACGPQNVSSAAWASKVGQAGVWIDDVVAVRRVFAAT
jgi:hypothetical protein